MIAGLRWDTSYSKDGDRSGPGWSAQMRPGGGFRLRHPLGLLQATPCSNPIRLSTHQAVVNLGCGDSRDKSRL